MNTNARLKNARFKNSQRQTEVAFERPFKQSSVSVLTRYLNNSAEGSALKRTVQAELRIRVEEAVRAIEQFALEMEGEGA